MELSSMDMDQRWIKIPRFVCGTCTGDLPHRGFFGWLNLCAVALWDFVVKKVSPLGVTEHVGTDAEGEEREREMSADAVRRVSEDV